MPLLLAQLALWGEVLPTLQTLELRFSNLGLEKRAETSYFAKSRRDRRRECGELDLRLPTLLGNSRNKKK